MTQQFSNETSLYLRQHADNPVDWWPWCDAAFAEAVQRDCPVLVSIGYASCHWCHVMAHESFEDAVSAAQMNREFVNIKVDREERPDVDQFYQYLHQQLHQSPGGWPLTVFLNPKTRLPLFTGTYFPNRRRHQMPAFAEVMTAVTDAWLDRRTDLEAQGEQIQAALAVLANSPLGTGTLPNLDATLKLGKERLLQAADRAAGGFGQAPKFPMLTSLRLLLAVGYYEKRIDDEALTHLRRSLIGMARGGLFDHVGGGFFRYSTDEKWLIPHFEKMLYDNAQHLSLYAEALPVLDDGLLAQSVRRTADWLQREMQTAEGGYCASVDADSNGREGAFYVWQRREIEKLLSDDEYILAETLYGLDRAPQFEDAWHLHRTDSWPSVLRRLNLDEAEGQARLESIWRRLRQARAERPPPTRDAKIITAWNGLAIKGMVQAAQALDEPAYWQSARLALDFICKQMWRDNRLGGVYDQGQMKPQAFLDDYACLMDALLKMMAYRWRAEDAQMALALADVVLNHFRDSEAGGFYFTSDEDDPLPLRHKPMEDAMVPCANALIAGALHQLGHLFARGDFLEAAEETLLSFTKAIADYPEQHAQLVWTLRQLQRTETTVVIYGPEAALAERQAWLKPYVNVSCFAIPVEAAQPLPPYLQDELKDVVAADSKNNRTVPQIYLCHQLTCQPPCTERSDLEAMLKAEKRLI